MFSAAILDRERVAFLVYSTAPQRLFCLGAVVVVVVVPSVARVARVVVLPAV